MKLSNQDIWLAYPKLVELSKVKFPIKTGLGVAKLLKKLQEPYAIIEHERVKLVNHWGVKNLETKQVSIDPSSLEAGDFAREFGELLITEWGDDFQIEKIKLPDKIQGKCDGCEKNLDIVFLIDPQVLMPLEKFIEPA